MRGLLTALAMLGVVVLLAISLDMGVPGQELLGTLRFHIAAALLVLSLLLGLVGARRRAALMLVLIVLSAGQGAMVVLGQQQARQTLTDRAVKASFEALSFNVLGTNPTGAAAAQYIVSSGADVVVLMEGRGIERQLDAVAAQYPYRLGCEPDVDCDLAILSRMPLIDPQKHMLRELSRWRLFQAAIDVDGQRVTIVALHLSKPYFDAVTMGELIDATRVIATIKGPVLLMGDFNAAAWSDRVATFVRWLSLVPPPGHPATWPVELAQFGVPIDNMFTRGGALIRQIEATPSAFGSNHLGLKANVDLF